MNTLQKILKLIEKNNIKNKDLADYIGLNKQVITSWKSGKNKSYNKYIGPISEFFNVPASELLNDEYDKTDFANITNSIYDRQLQLLFSKSLLLQKEYQKELIKLLNVIIELYELANKANISFENNHSGLSEMFSMLESHMNLYFNLTLQNSPNSKVLANNKKTSL